MSKSLEQELTALKSELDQYKSIVREMTVPLIDSAILDTLLVPLSGHLFNERINAINEKLFIHLEKNRQIKILVVDFTGILPSDLRYITGTDLSLAIGTSNSSLKLLGIRSIYTGFHPEVVFEITKSGFTEDLETYPTYRMAISQLSKEKNLFYSMDIK